jgi:hypothetical protein
MHVAACCLYFMPHMKLHKVKKRTAEPKNVECRMSKDGIASLTLFLKNGQNTLTRVSGKNKCIGFCGSGFPAAIVSNRGWKVASTGVFF